MQSAVVTELREDLQTKLDTLLEVLIPNEAISADVITAHLETMTREAGKEDILCFIEKISKLFFSNDDNPRFRENSFVLATLCKKAASLDQEEPFLKGPTALDWLTSNFWITPGSIGEDALRLLVGEMEDGFIISKKSAGQILTFCSLSTIELILSKIGPIDVKHINYTLQKSCSEEKEFVEKDRILQLLLNHNVRFSSAEMVAKELNETNILKLAIELGNDDETIEVLFSNGIRLLNAEPIFAALEITTTEEGLDKKYRIIELLLSRKDEITGGIDAEGKGLAGKETALMRALRCQDDERIIKLLIDRGANINHVVKEDGNFPLLVAASRKTRNGDKFKSDFVSCILSYPEGNSKINETNVEGDTPLIRSIETGGVSTIKALVENGADVNQKVGRSDNPFESPKPLVAAILMPRSGEIIKYLMDSGATQETGLDNFSLFFVGSAHLPTLYNAGLILSSIGFLNRDELNFAMKPLIEKENLVEFDLEHFEGFAFRHFKDVFEFLLKKKSYEEIFEEYPILNINPKLQEFSYKVILDLFANPSFHWNAPYECGNSFQSALYIMRIAAKKGNKKAIELIENPTPELFDSIIREHEGEPRKVVNRHLTEIALDRKRVRNDNRIFALMTSLDDEETLFDYDDKTLAFLKNTKNRPIVVARHKDSYFLSSYDVCSIINRLPNIRLLEDQEFVGELCSMELLAQPTKLDLKLIYTTLVEQLRSKGIPEHKYKSCAKIVELIEKRDPLFFNGKGKEETVEDYIKRVAKEKSTKATDRSGASGLARVDSGSGMAGAGGGVGAGAGGVELGGGARAGAGSSGEGVASAAKTAINSLFGFLRRRRVGSEEKGSLLGNSGGSEGYGASVKEQLAEVVTVKDLSGLFGRSVASGAGSAVDDIGGGASGAGGRRPPLPVRTGGKDKKHPYGYSAGAGGPGTPAGAGEGGSGGDVRLPHTFGLDQYRTLAAASALTATAARRRGSETAAGSTATGSSAPGSAPQTGKGGRSNSDPAASRLTGEGLGISDL